MVDKDETPRSGVHRKKRQVDRLWLNYQLKQAGLTVTGFGAALGREMKRKLPYDKASVSRRLSGRIPFTALEVEALSRMFNTPLEEVLQRVGSSATDIADVVGTLAADGRVTFELDVSPRDRFYRLRLMAQDGWADAVFTVAAPSILPQNADRGVYVVRVNGTKTCLCQYLGVHGKQALLAAAFDASLPVDTIPATAISGMQRVTKITL